MKLIEFVVLMGAHCVSPVQQMPSMTDVGKVQCAVVVEKDTQTGTFKITPNSAAADERVLAVIEKLTAETADSDQVPRPMIVPVAAPPGGDSGARVSAPPEDIAPAVPPDTAKPPEPVKQEAAAQPVPAPEKPKETLQCKGGATPKWYKADNGHRKYRCVKD